MNILFISFDADPPFMGGTATVVNTLAKAFLKNGHGVALGYFKDSKYPSKFFQYKVKISNDNRKELDRFFKQHKFDVIYNTQALSTDFRLLKSLNIKNCKIVSAYHNKPQLHYLPLESLMNLFYESRSPLYKLYTLAKIPLLPIWKYISYKKDRDRFFNMVINSDKIQLLSERFYSSFLKIVPNIDTTKLFAIGNPIVFSRMFPIDQLPNKEKKVVVVCSTNYQKRANAMIRIWAELEKDEQFAEWSFDFVGGGDGFDRLKKLSNHLGIQRLHFFGYQNPQVYYERGSIFLMTSRYEGWPMVLMEAMQMGVVPVVYNSFESLTDIVEDGVNGCIVPNNDMNSFLNTLKWLMKSDKLRLTLATNAILSCEHHTIDKVYEKYLGVFTSLIEK